MSKFTKEKIYEYADKLLIGLSEEENALVLNEFDLIDNDLNLVSTIDNLENVEPMTHCLDDFEYVLREDDKTDNMSVRDLLSNCDVTSGMEVVVPKVVR